MSHRRLMVGIYQNQTRKQSDYLRSPAPHVRMPPDSLLQPFLPPGILSPPPFAIASHFQATGNRLSKTTQAPVNCIHADSQSIGLTVLYLRVSRSKPEPEQSKI